MSEHVEKDPCLRAAQLMHRLLDDELDEALALEIRHHVDACVACTEGFDVEVTIRSTLQRCCREEAPASLRDRIVTLRIQRG